MCVCVSVSRQKKDAADGNISNHNGLRAKKRPSFVFELRSSRSSYSAFRRWTSFTKRRSIRHHRYCCFQRKLSFPFWLIYVVVHDRHRGNAIGTETTAESVFFFH